MTVTEIVNALSKRQKGTYVQIEWGKTIKLKKDAPKSNVITKITQATVRWGINYNNLKRVKELKAEKEANGIQTKERAPWYTHMEKNPYILQNISDPTKTYLQIYTINKAKSIKSKYYINGVEATKQQILDSGLVNKSDISSSQQECLTMTIPTCDIKRIGKKED